MVVVSEGGRGTLSVVSLCRINVTLVSTHRESNKSKSPPASLPGYKPAVTQPLYVCLFITEFSQHAFKSEESGHHIFHRLITVHRYELLLTKHRLHVRRTGALNVFPEQICLWVQKMSRYHRITRLTRQATLLVICDILHRSLDLHCNSIGLHVPTA